jgi:hypothetical protein
MTAEALWTGQVQVLARAMVAAGVRRMALELTGPETVRFELDPVETGNMAAAGERDERGPGSGESPAAAASLVSEGCGPACPCGEGVAPVCAAGVTLPFSGDDYATAAGETVPPRHAAANGDAAQERRGMSAEGSETEIPKAALTSILPCPSESAGLPPVGNGRQPGQGLLWGQAGREGLPLMYLGEYNEAGDWTVRVAPIPLRLPGNGFTLWTHVCVMGRETPKGMAVPQDWTRGRYFIRWVNPESHCLDNAAEVQHSLLYGYGVLVMTDLPVCGIMERRGS